MTNVRKKQLKTLAIVFVAVLGLTIGFSAFSSSLLIKTRLSVNPNNGTFLVKFSKSSSILDEDPVVPVKSSDVFTAYNATIDNSGIPTISNLGGQFTQPGEKITYNFFTLNTGSYNAYLTDVIFNNVDGESTNKVCTSVDGTHQTEVDEACNAISIKVIMGIDTIIGTRSMAGHTLEPNQSEPVKVVIEYSSNAALPEVEFTVEFGTIGMIYNSLEETDVPQQEQPVQYSFINRSPDTCYLSLQPGQLNYYNPNAQDCGTPGEIPTSLQVTPATVSFDENRCVAFIEALQNRGEQVPSSFGNATPSQICAAGRADVEEGLASLDFSTAPLFYILDQDFLSMGYDGLSFAPIDIEFGAPTGQYYPVTSIAQTALQAKSLTSVVIPDSVTTIGEAAFATNNLSSITIPASVTTIEDVAFAENSNLTSLIISSGRTSTLTVGEYAFGSGITSVTTNSQNSYLNLTNESFAWESENACYMSTDGDLTTSACAN